MLIDQTFNLLELIEAHRAKTGMTKTAFGRAALGDPALVFEMERGRELRRKTVAKIVAFIVSGSQQEAAAK